MDYLEQVFVGVAQDTISQMGLIVAALGVMFGLGMLYLGVALAWSGLKMRRLSDSLAAIARNEPEVPPSEYIDPVPEFRDSAAAAGATASEADALVELTVSFGTAALSARYGSGRDPNAPTAADLMQLVTAAVPEAELLTGNVRYAISVRIPASQEAALKKALAPDCHVAPRTTVEFFAN